MKMTGKYRKRNRNSRESSQLFSPLGLAANLLAAGSPPPSSTITISLFQFITRFLPINKCLILQLLSNPIKAVHINPFSLVREVHKKEEYVLNRTTLTRNPSCVRVSARPSRRLLPRACSPTSGLRLPSRLWPHPPCCL
jgi:hypothetical protein